MCATPDSIFFFRGVCVQLSCHEELTSFFSNYFFLPAIALAGPLRVRALFLYFDHELVNHDGGELHGMNQFPSSV